MSYIKTTWIDEETVLTARALNNIEDGIVSVESNLTNLASKIGVTITPVESRAIEKAKNTLSDLSETLESSNKVSVYRKPSEISNNDRKNIKKVFGLK